MLEQIGFKKENFHLITQPTRFAKVYVPDNCFQNLRYTQEYLDFFNRLPTLPTPKNLNVEQVYFSRTALSTRKDFNGKVIENLFKNQGFTIIYPEKNTFLENLAILQNCKVFAATEGSISHNVLFCRKVEKIIILL